MAATLANNFPPGGPRAVLVLSDGSRYEGVAFGAAKSVGAEVGKHKHL